MSDLILAILGGLIMGSAAAGLMLFNGRVHGISGIYAALLSPKPGDLGWRLSFLGGLFSGGLLLNLLAPEVLEDRVQIPLWLLLISGLLVGIGTRLGSGCASGHGICGLGRFSPRSLVATLSFVGVGMLVATLLSPLLGIG